MRKESGLRETTRWNDRGRALRIRVHECADAQNGIDAPAPLVFDRAKTTAASAKPRSRDQRVNLLAGSFCLDQPDQVLALVRGETTVCLGRRLGTLDEAHYR